jgi:hypothetical protein
MKVNVPSVPGFLNSDLADAYKSILIPQIINSQQKIFGPKNAVHSTQLKKVAALMPMPLLNFRQQALSQHRTLSDFMFSE